MQAYSIKKKYEYVFPCKTLGKMFNQPKKNNNKTASPLPLVDFWATTLSCCFYLVSRPHPTPPAPLPSQCHLNTYHWPGCPPPAAATTCKSVGAQATWRVLSRPSTSASLLTRARLRRWPPLTWTASRVSVDEFSFSRFHVLKTCLEGLTICECCTLVGWTHVAPCLLDV